MALSGLTRACGCHTLIEDPAAAACPKCSRILTPHHSAWPLFTKWFGLSEMGRRRHHAWMSEQQVWEWIMKDTMTPHAMSAARPLLGPKFNASTPASELYPEYVKLAQRWKAAGSPIARWPELEKAS